MKFPTHGDKWLGAVKNGVNMHSSTLDNNARFSVSPTCSQVPIRT